MKHNSPTSGQIIRSALELLLKQGIKKCSLEAVAHAAGVTRMTVYRYFPDKQALTGAALMSIPAMLEELRDELKHNPQTDLQSGLKQLGERFSRLPHGNLLLLLDETQRVYPELWRQFQQRRISVITEIFQFLLSKSEAQGLLRPGLNPVILQAYFYASVTRVMEDPALTSLGLSGSEVFNTVQSIFLYGILKEEVE